MAASALPAEERPAKKRKAAKFDQADAVVVDTSNAVPSTSPERRKKRMKDGDSAVKKSRRKTDTQLSAVSQDLEDGNGPSVVHGETSTPAVDGISNAVAVLPKKKRKREAAVPEEANSQPTGLADPLKKKRKSKALQESESSSNALGGDAAVPLGTDAGLAPVSDKVVKKAKKKKRLKVSGLLDPTSDESLSEQARNALLYARSFLLSVETPPVGEWKFNKARQNWLVRNVLDERAVPEAYADGVLKYLATVKGGVRDSLMQTCKRVLDAETPAAVAAPEAPAAGEEPAVPAEDGAAVTDLPASRFSRARAERLINLLEAS